MARLKLDALDVLTAWLESPQCAEGDRALLVDLVESVGDDTWNSGRWYCLYDPRQEVYDCQPRAGLHIVMYEEPDEMGEWAVGIVSIQHLPEDEGGSGLPV